MSERQRALIEEDCARAVTDPQALAGLRDTHVFITGGSGFVAAWLLETIAYLNDAFAFDTQVTAIAREPANLEMRAPHLASRGDIVLLEADVRSDFEIPTDCSWILHLAATPDPRVHLSKPVATVDTIVNGTLRTLYAASRLPALKMLLNCSSGQIYGGQPPNVEGLAENLYSPIDCTALRSSYVEGKRVAETLCQGFRSQMGLPVVTARPFSFVGPYQYAVVGPYQLLERPWAINNFIKRAMEGGPLRITADERTVRSYMYPSDLAFWFLRILTAGETGLAYNVGSPDGHSLRDIAETVARCFATPPAIVPAATSKRDTSCSRFVPNVDRAREHLGLQITVSFEEAVSRTIRWINSG